MRMAAGTAVIIQIMAPAISAAGLLRGRCAARRYRLRKMT
jgi:hypothetical protein